MAFFWMSFRLREARRPLTARRIVLPPLGMSTGAFMYLVPNFRPSPVAVAFPPSRSAFPPRLKFV